jgi:hypothetical protein
MTGTTSFRRRSAEGCARVGKRATADVLQQFLAGHAEMMGRTALRFAIERLPPHHRRRRMPAYLI